ncbi:MAG: DUF3102 domain-containing protein [Sedimentisphaerales bacterium]|nr:DUF3102 domain-containing protein [Sedimentisphaerales bacterium]
MSPIIRLPQPENEPERCAVEIRKCLKQANASYRLAVICHSEALEHFRDCGAALLRAKKMFHHGSWKKWVAENFVGRSYESAVLYMRLAKGWKSKRLQRALHKDPLNVTLVQALELIRQPKLSPAQNENTTEDAKEEKPLTSKQKKIVAQKRNDVVKLFRHQLGLLDSEQIGALYDLFEHDIWPLVLDTLGKKQSKARSRRKAG